MIPYVLLGVCVLLVAWLTAGGMAIRSASRIWLRHWAEQRLHGAESVHLYLERPQRLIAAANAGVALAIGLGALWIGWASREHENTVVMRMALYAAIVVFAGQVIPRAVGRRWPLQVIPIAIPVLRAAQVITEPLLSMGRKLTRSEESPAASNAQSHETMQDLLREGELEGVGRRDEIAIISGVMQFGEKTVFDVMTPTDDIFAISENLDVQSAAVQIAESAFSRVPVYQGSMDRIVGMYHAFDLLKAPAEHLPPLRPVAYTPADTPCNDLLFRMLRARLHLAVVHDAFGHTVGIATLEDLLEELVGDIRDEHDEPISASASGAAKR